MNLYTSANTSINTTRLPAIYNKINWNWLLFVGLDLSDGHTPVVLDYGCGRETKHIQKFLESEGFAYLGYDPYWKSKKENAIALNYKPDIVVCSNVLSVICSNNELERVHDKVSSLSRSGHYFISVYEGDKSCVGRQTKPDCWQRNQPTKNYLRRNEICKHNVIAGAKSEKYIL